MIYRASEDQFVWGQGQHHKIKANVYYKNRETHLLSFQMQHRYECIPKAEGVVQLF